MVGADRRFILEMLAWLGGSGDLASVYAYDMTAWLGMLRRARLRPQPFESTRRTILEAYGGNASTGPDFEGLKDQQLLTFEGEGTRLEPSCGWKSHGGK